MKIKKRQRQILDHLSNGDTNQEIADKLHISPIYVQNLLCGLYQLTETRNKHHLLSWAYKNRILSIEEEQNV